MAKQQSQFEYNTTNDLVKVTDPKGSQFKYEYDKNDVNVKKHNLTKATSAENVVYTFTYDPYGYGNPTTSKIEDQSSIVNGNATKYIESDATYTTSGNYIKTIKDSIGNTITNNWDETKGLLKDVTDAKNKVTTYGYDTNTDRLLSVSKTVDGSQITNSYGYLNDRLNSVTHNSFSYNFGYDSLGNNTTVSVGTQNLITNSYESRTSKLLQSKYGNGQTVKNNYDEYNRVIGKSVIEGTVSNPIERSLFKYSYDAGGNLGYQEDLVNGVNYRYTYDTAGRLVRVKDNKGNEFGPAFDKINNITSNNEIINSNGYLTSYSYDKDNRETGTTYSRIKLPNGKGEVFPLNGSSVGTKGTNSSANPAFVKEDGKMVLSAAANTNALYKLGLSKKSGTLAVWFKTKETNTTRYIMATDGNGSNQMLDMYIDTDNKLHIGVRDSTTNWVVLASSSDTISPNTWYYAAVSWKDNNGVLEGTLYLNDKSTTGTTSNYGDFSGLGMAIGATPSGTYPVNGFIEQLAYVPEFLDKTQIDDIRNSGRSSNVTVTYDGLGRVKSKDIYTTGNSIFNVTLGYKNDELTTGSKTTQISSITNNGQKISYTYDANGNIETLNQNGYPVKYYYNELNELIREDNQTPGINATIVYSYDIGGNIKDKKIYAYQTGTTLTGTPTTIGYTYDATWKDQLKYYNGLQITYDAIGNPLNDSRWTYSWEQGRLLLSLSNASNSISYKYNNSGIRTQKIVNNIPTNYHLVGDKVTYEDNVTDKIYYTYDSSDNLVSMNLNGVEYYYIRNAQGDIIGLFDKNGATVATYTYDSWGKLISIKDGSGIDITNNTVSVGYKNPYRYKGYRYDTETGLYYLNSRYYNPEWGRFINADGITGQVGELLSHNMFAYCKNNRVPRLKHS